MSKRWNSLVRGVLQPTKEQMATWGESGLAIVSSDEVWLNDQYQVNVTRHIRCPGWGETKVTHLSIKRLDKAPARNWRHFQYIKNQLCGPDVQGVEIYPQEAYLVDTSNQYHLWVFEDRNMILPFGFYARVVSEQEFAGAVQEPWEKNMRPDDMTDMRYIASQFKKGEL